MVIAYHLILSAYGFWLPNDPRGCWSDFVGAWDVFRAAGRATRVQMTRSVAHVPHDRALRLRSKRALKYPPVRFTGRQVQVVVQGFTRAADEGSYTVHACAMLPEHCHLIVARSGRPIERVASHLKAHATRALRAAGEWPGTQSPWAHDHWGVFIDDQHWLRSAVAYVERNPQEEGKRPQRWRFVRPLPALGD